MKCGTSQRYVRLIVAAFVVGVLSVCFSPNAQSRTKASGPKPTPSHLSVELEGTGALVPTSTACDSNGTCLGMLTAALTGLPSAASLSLEVFLNDTPHSKLTSFQSTVLHHQWQRYAWHVRG